jgi:hypothetical protein
MILMTRSRAPVAVLAVSLLCGCAGWHRLEIASDTTLAPRQQVQVWQGSRARLFHAVRVSGDSLIGVPFQQAPTCDSCRVGIPRSAVDSLRLGNMETAGILAWSLPFLALAFLAAALSGMGD